MARIYRLVTSLVVWFALILQFYLITRGRTGGDLVQVAVNFFSFFTILSNLLCALALASVVLAPRSAVGAFFARSAVRGGITLYIGVTGAIYVTILQGLWNPTGLQWVADILLHYATPIIFIVDWLLFTPRARLAWRTPLTWMVFPLAYCAWTLVRGPLADWYPYPFMDVSQLGMPRVLLNSLGVAGLFGLLGLGLVVIDRALANARWVLSEPSKP